MAKAKRIGSIHKQMRKAFSSKKKAEKKGLIKARKKAISRLKKLRKAEKKVVAKLCKDLPKSKKKGCKKKHTLTEKKLSK